MRTRTPCAGLLVALLGLSSAHAQPELPSSPDAAPASAPRPVAEAKPKPEGPVTLTFGTRGPSATVYYGKRQLGTTPFQLKWKRDSGPLDLVFRAAGHFPVNTRIHTVDDEKLFVELTPRNKAYTLFGYRAPIRKAVPEGDLEDRPLEPPPPGGPRSPSSAPKRPAPSDPGLAPVAPRPPRELKPVAPVRP